MKLKIVLLKYIEKQAFTKSSFLLKNYIDLLK